MSLMRFLCGLMFAAALGSPTVTLAQELVIQAEGGGETHVLFRKRIDKSTPLIAQALITHALGATGLSYTSADVEAIVGTATAKWDQWHKDFVILGNCGKDPSAGATVPSGSFRYLIRCRNCSKASC